jgi:YesN/AraC family two-component response regulator
MSEKKHILLEKIKRAVIDFIHYADEPVNIKFSNHLSELLDYDYTYLSNLFSELHGTTLEQYIISHKIERVKQMLIYEELSLTDIAFKMGYSSVAHLSYQFKKTTGVTPSGFRKMNGKPLGDTKNQ